MLLSTVHRIKGREWGNVIVFGATSGQFPHRLSDDEEGERRVFHVAITRGKERVAVLGAEDAPSIFVDELDGSRPHPPPGGARNGRAGPSAEDRQRARKEGRGRRVPAGRPPMQEATVAAALGLVIEQGGQRGEIVELTATGAVQQVGGARVAVPFGSPVRIEGRTLSLAPPEPDAGFLAAAEEALRSWRRAVAAREKVPAYIVFNDRELSGIARRAPRSLAELAGCPGIGPIKLERWGDEVLALLQALPVP